MPSPKASPAQPPTTGPSVLLSIDERLDKGRKLREKVSRRAHQAWVPPKNRFDPVELIRDSDRGRVPQLVPIRYKRMAQSSFAFFRGSAVLMAADLARTPSTGIRVQACGDCHLANFGGFASPERRFLFDVNDFDETLPAPWEWDLKRLATSIVLAGAELGATKRQCGDAAEAVARSYRTRMRLYARKHALETWCSHIEANVLIEQAASSRVKKYWKAEERRARAQAPQHLLEKMTKLTNGRRRIADRPPLVFHPSKPGEFMREADELFARYRQTLPPERRILLDRYRLVDAAAKVVGVGAVGTRCGLLLLMAEDDDPLFLQFKQAQASVLEAHAGKSRYLNHAERVVVGQRMLQASSDVFLGWTHDDQGRDFYFRQLRDMKMDVDLGSLSKPELLEYGRVCAWALARGHARTGDAAQISGYLGKKNTFDKAIRQFALAYTVQVDRDYREFLKVIRSGKAG
jgi:uncharacterized protein (DUF2252 family)